MEFWDRRRWLTSFSQFFEDFRAVVNHLASVSQFDPDYGQTFPGNSKTALAVLQVQKFVQDAKAINSIQHLPVSTMRLQQAADWFEEDLLRELRNQYSVEPQRCPRNISGQAYYALLSELASAQVCAELETAGTQFTCAEIASMTTAAGYEVSEKTVSNRFSKAGIASSGKRRNAKLYSESVVVAAVWDLFKVNIEQELAE